MNNEEAQQARQRLESLSVLLDSSIAIPGTSWRIGVEPLLGLVPVVGDFAGLALGLVFVGEALRMGAPRATVVRMLGNLALDTAAGAVPVAGDLFDFAFKSHRRNIAVLREWLDVVHPPPVPLAPPAAPRGRAGWIAATLVVLALAAVWYLRP